jgi:hypothetical protein
MGRHRTTGCTARHFPGEPCRACEALRARRSRDRAALRRKREEKAAKAAAEADRKREAARACGKPVAPAAAVECAASAPPAPDPERAALDRAAAEHRRLLQRALRHVATYRKRGAIIPPDACERCGIGERITPWSRPIPLFAWHPDPRKKTEVVWLCVHCRRRVRAVREPIVLTWVWPGGVPARRRGRPVVDALDVKAIVPGKIPGSLPIIEPDAEAVAPRASLPGLAAELFLHAFLEAAGPDLEALYAQGARAGERWRPLGDPMRDAALRKWVARERASRARGEKLAQVVPAWQRRPRRDRPTLRPPAPPPDEGGRDREPALFDEASHAEQMAAALERLSAAEAKADAALERVQRALEQLRACSK